MNIPHTIPAVLVILEYGEALPEGISEIRNLSQRPTNKYCDAVCEPKKGDILFSDDDQSILWAVESVIHMVSMWHPKQPRQVRPPELFVLVRKM